MQASTSNACAKIRAYPCPSVGEKGVRDASNSVITSKFALIIIVNTIALNLDMFLQVAIALAASGRITLDTVDYSTSNARA